MSTSIISVDALGKQDVIIPVKNSFYRRLGYTDWEDISIIAVLGVTTTGAVNTTPSDTTISDAVNYYNRTSLGVRNYANQNKLPGYSGCSFAGLQSKNGSGWLSATPGFNDAGGGNHYSTVSNGTTLNQAASGSVSMYTRSGGAYVNYIPRVVRIKKFIADNKIAITTNSNQTLVDLSPASLVSYAASYAATPVLANGLTFNFSTADELDTFFFFTPLNIRAMFFTVLVNKNA